MGGGGKFRIFFSRLRRRGKDGENKNKRSHSEPVTGREITRHSGNKLLRKAERQAIAWPFGCALLPLLHLRAPVNDQSQPEEEKRAAAEFRLMDQNIGSPRRRNH